MRKFTIDDFLEAAENYYKAFDDRMFDEKSIPFMRGYEHGKRGAYKNPYKMEGFIGLYDRGYSYGLKEVLK
jgi:hypothetical protein